MYVFMLGFAFMVFHQKYSPIQHYWCRCVLSFVGEAIERNSGYGRALGVKLSRCNGPWPLFCRLFCKNVNGDVSKTCSRAESVQKKEPNKEAIIFTF